MSVFTASILAMLGLTEAEHARGWKSEAVTLADGSTRQITIRRFATQENNLLALQDYAQKPDARYLLAQMIEGGCAPTFFDSLAIGELDRLNNLCLVLLTSLEWLEHNISAQAQKLTSADLTEVITQAEQKIAGEIASHEGGFHG